MTDKETTSEETIHPLLAKVSKSTGKRFDKLPSFDPDLVPDISQDRPDDGLSGWLDPIDIVDTYNRWAGKGTVDAKGRVESIKVRCPNPTHEDRHPSAWLNLTKGDGGVGVCASCGGFDKYVIFGWNSGIVPAGRPVGSAYPEVRRRMAAELGATITTVGGNTVVVESTEETQVDGTDAPQEPLSGDGAAGSAVVEPASEGSGEGAALAEVASPPPTPPPDHPLLAKIHKADPADGLVGRVEHAQDPASNVIDINSGEPIAPQPWRLNEAHLEWEDFVKEDTFLWHWMTTLAKDTDIPHEYILFNGLVALAAVLKRNVYLDEARRVYTNLMVLLFGDTSTGKSRSFDPLMKILNDVDPYVFDDTRFPVGTKHLGVFGSGESLISGLRHPVIDKTTLETVAVAGVSAIAKMEEFSLAVSMARRTGSSLKEYLMSIYDTGSASHTSLGNPDLTVNDAFLQVISTTQPDAVYEFLKRSDAFSGFLNRWVIVSGRNRMGRHLSTYEPHEDLGTAEMALREIKYWAEESEHPMRFTGEAFDYWDSFYGTGIKGAQASGSPMLARWDLTLKKILVLFAANEDLENPTSDLVYRITKHFYPYMKEVYMSFGEKMADDEREKIFEEALAYIEDHYRRHSRWPSVRDMKKSRVGKQFGGVKVVDACDWAARMGLIARELSSQTIRFAMIRDS